MKSKEIIEKVLNSADVKINGGRPFDLKVHDERLYDRILSKGTLGIGEAYMDGWWDCEDLSEMVNRFFRYSDSKAFSKNLTNFLHILKTKVINLQTKTGSKDVAKEHYDLGNDLYLSFLDKNNQYTCGYFEDTDDLDVAQEKKLDLICKKLQLKPTDRLLDIGCGWGGLAKYAAEHYGCHVTGISISEEQIKYGQEATKGLPVEIINMDYRDIVGKFDKIVSVGMFEHVGYKNYREFFETVSKILKDDGIFLLHTIGQNVSGTSGDQWFEKYIFPNSMLPSPKQMTTAFEKLFVMEDWHNFGQYYDKTLLAWWSNFDKKWPKFKDKYGERFYRMFRYYMLSFAGTFRARHVGLWQIVLTKRGMVGGYKSIR